MNVTNSQTGRDDNPAAALKHTQISTLPAAHDQKRQDVPKHHRATTRPTTQCLHQLSSLLEHALPRNYIQNQTHAHTHRHKNRNTRAYSRATAPLRSQAPTCPSTHPQKHMLLTMHYMKYTRASKRSHAPPSSLLTVSNHTRSRLPLPALDHKSQLPKYT